MKTNKLTSIIAVCLILFQTSCQDFLDVDPVGKLIPTKVVELENLLNNSNTYDYLFLDNNRGCFYALLGDNITFDTGLSETLYYATHPNINRYHAYIFALPYSNPVSAQYFWTYNYRAISYFNNVIAGIDNLSAAEKNSDHAKEVIAEAKAGRAWQYLQQVLVYGPPYNPAGANDQKVIPYRTAESPLAPNPPLHTVAEIYDFLLQDLTAALDAPEMVGNPTRAGKTAVLALHAQYYMFKRDWQNMLKYADEAWNLALNLEGSVDNLIYNFNDFEYSKTTVTVAEGIDSAYYWNLRHKGGDLNFRQAYNRESLLYRVSPVTGQNHYVSDDFLSLFDTKNDLRFKLFILNYNGWGNDGIRKFNYRGSKLIYNEGLSYPDLLLMRAEAYARNGQPASALADLNLLRKYRYDNASSTDLTNGASLNADQLLVEILKERRLEQPFESFLRTVDIKRYTLDTGKPWSKTTITHTIGDKTYSAPVNDQYFNVPIDNGIITLNPDWGLSPDNTSYVAKPE